MKAVIGFVLICVVNAGDWTYKGHEGPPDWAEHFKNCSGTSQSPIDLNFDVSTCGEGDGRPKTYFGDSCRGTLANNGHSVQFDFNTIRNVKIGSNKYTILQFHFHWGSDPKHKGSEHTENGKHRQMEMHVVSKQIDGTALAVMAFFFDVGGEDNEALLPLTDTLKDLKEVGVPHDLTLNVREILAPAIKGTFYRYEGSLTTPPCSEIVLWTVYHNVLKLSEGQMAEFRAIGIADNFRPIQPLDGRTLYNSAKPC